ncbi:MAG: hypothetical protein N2Z76_01020 [Treponemataceae bacterium]|nr:hypothetical protein [Treponemataceae bacterium]
MKATISFNSRQLFWAGLIALPAIFLTQTLEARIYLWALFLGYTRLLGKRNRFFITFFVMIGIVGANLLIPTGKVLMEIGAFPLTQGALARGLERAFLLETLVFLSKASIQRDLVFPGRFGDLIGQSIYYFEEFLEMSKNLSWRTPLKSMDRLLLDLTREKQKGHLLQETPSLPPTDSVSAPFMARFLLALAVVLAYLPLTIEILVFLVFKKGK